MEEQIEKRLRELSARSWNRGIPCFTDFLNLNEQAALQRIRRSLPQPEAALFGGAEGCERVMAGFGLTEGETEGFPIACLRVSPLSAKFAEDLSHRDLLGALMSLGFDRSLVGDIVLRESCAWVFCAERIADFICGGLTSVRRTSVRAERAEPPEGELFRLTQETVQVSSERMDALVARVFRLSRGDAQSLFPAGRVFLDGAECPRPDAAPREGQVISVRGLGRFRYAGAASQSRKGKWNVQVERYV